MKLFKKTPVHIGKLGISLFHLLAGRRDTQHLAIIAMASSIVSARSSRTKMGLNTTEAL